ncbi:TLD domain containing protein [Nitzschia inconspicua]|uniref:Oxidation resistance protein 1 n=1 Tax=Nitzschia inconspicua TaxID=303405 RepID=A0A9K3KT06_9STRA|nr:TLD domain containing protein [Nitzschia inconspicua]
MKDDSTMLLRGRSKTPPPPPPPPSKMKAMQETLHMKGRQVSVGRQLSVVKEEEDPYFFSEFLFFCSNKFWSGDDGGNSNNAAATEDDPETIDDCRNSITKLRSTELDSIVRNKDDSWSCDSTLESSGMISHESPQQKFRFFMDPDDASVATLASTDDRSLFLKERWNAIYTPDIKSTSHIDTRTCKTEGAKPTSSTNNINVFNMNFLESPQNCAPFDSRVLGTSSSDDSAKPIVLTASIMDALQRHLPYSKQGEMFWLKYSMIRDGANLNTVLNKTKRSSYTVLAVETLDGEVFGAFTAKPWHITWEYFGTPESFLWRLRKRRKGYDRDKPLAEGDFEVFRFASNNKNIQMCHVDKIAVGGGSPDDCDACTVSDELSHIKLTEWGFGLAFGKDLQQGTSSPCTTFNSPSLSRYHADGSRFEVANMEFWTLTPCISLDEAKRMEMTKELFSSNSVAW